MTREEAQKQLTEYSFASNTYGSKKERFVDIRLGNAKGIMDDVFDAHEIEIMELKEEIARYEYNEEN